MNRGPLLLGLLLVGAVASAGWVQSTSSKGAKLFWSSPCQLFYINERGCEDVADDSEFQAMIDSLKTWSAVDCSAFTFQYGGKTNLETTGYLEEKPAINMAVFRERKWPYSTRPVAFTAVTYNVETGEIFDADIEFNGEDYAFTTNPSAEPWKMDIENTMTHELGHVVGLDHTDVPAATMGSHAGPGDTDKRTLAEDDRQGICALYPVNGEESCTEVQPQYLFYDFPEEPEEGGCRMAATPAAGAILPLALLLFVLVACRRQRRVP